MTERMSRTDCVKRIVAASAGKITADEARDILRDYEGTARTIAKQKNIDQDTAARELKRAYADRLKTREALKARRKLIEAKILPELEEKVTRFKSAGLNTYNALQAVLTGTQKNIEGGRLSVSAQRIAHEEFLLNRFATGLREQQLTPYIKSREYEPEVAEALWDLSLPEDKSSRTTQLPKEAMQIAKVMKDQLDYLRERFNRGGANINPIEGYIGLQSHDTRKLISGGYTEWSNFVRPLIDFDRTLGTTDTKRTEAFLESFYEAVTSNLRKEQPGSKAPTQALADRLSTHRVLLFSDAKSAFDYNRIYGSGSLYETMVGQFHSSARDLSLLENLGPNPEKVWGELVNKTFLEDRDKLRSSDEKTRTKALAMFDKRYRLDSLYRYVSGELTSARNPTIGSVGQAIRMYQSFIRLGGAAISSLSDIPNKAIVMQSHGTGIFESYSRSIAHIGTKFTTPERKELAYKLSRMGGSPITDFVGRYNSDDSRVGRMGRIMRAYYKLNLMDWWQDSQKGGYAIDLSRMMGTFSRESFDTLPKEAVRDLTNAGITPEDWELIRKSTVKLSDGAQYLTTDGIRDPKITGDLKPEEVDRLETKLQTFFSDRAGHAIIEPGDWERWVLSLGTQKGTAAGEFMRIISQFKAYPLTFYTRAWGRILENDSPVMSMTQLAVMATLFGYVSNTILELSRGIKPKSIADPRALLAAYNRGGGLGILGEAAFSNYGLGKSLALTLAGPSARTVDDIASLFSTARAAASNTAAAEVLGEDLNPKDARDVGAAALRFTRSNVVPNLFYTRAAVDYLFYYNLLELSRPGAVSRMERKQLREYGTEYFIKPSEVVR